MAKLYYGSKELKEQHTNTKTAVQVVAKRQSLSTTVLFRTTLTRTNHAPPTYEMRVNLRPLHMSPVDQAGPVFRDLALRRNAL